MTKYFLFSLLVAASICGTAAAHDGQSCCKAKRTPKFSATFDGGFGFADQAPLDMNLTAGAKLSRFFYLGGGVNFTNWGTINTDVDARTDLNLIANPRFELPTRSSVTPYADLKMGYSLSPQGRFYIAPTLGVKIQNFMVGISYVAQETGFMKAERYPVSRQYVTNTGVTLRLGYSF